jgi:hypothetical protein
MKLFSVYIRHILILLLFSCMGFSAFSQEDTSEKLPFTFSAFVDAFYGYDFEDQTSGSRYPFLYNHNRKNRFGINLALISASYESGRIRANLGLQQGTYAEDNYSAEPKALRWIHQANAGYSLNLEKTIWLDVGVLPSHIGFESAISTENLTLSRSIIAENSPYFETGARLSWQRNELWYFAFLYLNGWQRIQSIPGKNIPSFGTQATYTPSNNLTLNWSTFLGTDQGKEAGTALYFSNIYADFKLQNGWRLIAGLDVGSRTIDLEANRNWWGTSVILQRRFTEKFASAFRYEYYHDPFQAIAASNVNEGIQTGGLSLNGDWKIVEMLTFRLEGRWLDAPSEFNLGLDTGSSSNFFLLGSLAWTWSSN